MAQLATPNRLVFPSRRFWIVATDKSSTDSNQALDVLHGLGMMNGPLKALARVFSMTSCFWRSVVVVADSCGRIKNGKRVPSGSRFSVTRWYVVQTLTSKRKKRQIPSRLNSDFSPKPQSGVLAPQPVIARL
jgi:hypothetical protein